MHREVPVREENSPFTCEVQWPILFFPAFIARVLPSDIHFQLGGK